MTNTQKLKKIQSAKDHRDIDRFYSLLEEMGDLKYNYHEYATAEPINIDKELERLEDADYELCTAFLTMMFREDHFCEGSLMERYESGQFMAVVDRMIKTLRQ